MRVLKATNPPVAESACYARMNQILTDAVAVANAIARSDMFASKDPRTRFYPERQ